MIKKMKIGFVSDRLNRNLTGVGNYVKNIVIELDKISKKEKIYLINYKKNDEYHFNNLKYFLIKHAKCKFKKLSDYLWHLYHLPKYLNKADFDLIHIPENVSFPFKLNTTKKVITVHDLIAYLFPNQVDIITAVRYKLLLKRVLINSQKIIVISENTKRDLIKHFDVKESKIRTIYLAANDNFRVLKNKNKRLLIQTYGIKSKYILYVGGSSKHKNIERLIDAVYMLTKTDEKLILVLAGKEIEKDKIVRKKIKKLKLEKRILFTGYVSEKNLVILYNNAECFVYPSLYEGFGLPPLEAMKCGCPVVVSKTSSIPEVVGDAGIYFNPKNINEMSSAIEKVIHNEKIRKKLSRRGLKQSKIFSWRKTAKETLKVYKEVMDEN